MLLNKQLMWMAGQAENTWLFFLGEKPTNMAPFTFTKKAMLTECIHSNLHERKDRKNTM